MKAAEEIYQIGVGVYGWQAWSPEAHVELHGTAISTAHGLIFIDPIPLAEPALLTLIASCPPRAIILTNANHERASDDFHRRFEVPRFAHEEIAISLAVEHSVKDGTLVGEELRVIALPGAAPGEIALYHEARELLIIGDALINLDSTDFSVLPAKYCADPKLLAQSLKKLLAFSVQSITFAHGLPVMQSARARLETLLSS